MLWIRLYSLWKKSVRVPSPWVVSPSPRPASQGVFLVHVEGYATCLTSSDPQLSVIPQNNGVRKTA